MGLFLEIWASWASLGGVNGVDLTPSRPAHRRHANERAAGVAAGVAAACQVDRLGEDAAPIQDCKWPPEAARIFAIATHQRVAEPVDPFSLQTDIPNQNWPHLYRLFLSA